MCVDTGSNVTAFTVNGAKKCNLTITPAKTPVMLNAVGNHNTVNVVGHVEVDQWVMGKVKLKKTFPVINDTVCEPAVAYIGLDSFSDLGFGLTSQFSTYSGQRRRLPPRN